MEREPNPALNPAALPPGTLVGPWRVVAWAGHGVHGTVYVAVHRDKPLSTPIALKVALLPRDPRFAREVELLSSLRHPSIPRLWDSGEWQLPSGALHPYIAMEWVDGVSLYDWARQHAPSTAQQLRVLAQLASALQAIHACGGVHRDVKGDFAEPTQNEHGVWQLEAVIPPASLQHNEPRVRALILRMLSVRPEQRGTPAQLAEALEQAARNSLLESAPQPSTEARQEALTPRERPTPLPERPSLPGDTSVRASISAPTRLRYAWALAAAVSLALAAGVWWVARDRTGEGTPIAHWTPARAEQPDAGPTGLGEALASASMESSDELCSPEMLAEDTLPETSEGQAQPDAKGRCPRKKQVALNGGCWAEFPLTGEECEERGGQIFKSKCYLPILLKKRRPTSNPTNQ